MHSDFVTLGADIGGKDAFSVINQHVLVLRSLLRQEYSRISKNSLKEIALVLRVDGSVQAWGKSGVDNISFHKKKAYVTADIFVPVHAWSTSDATSVRRFLIDQVACAIRLIVESANQQGIILDRISLENALENVRRQYLVN